MESALTHLHLEQSRADRCVFEHPPRLPSMPSAPCEFYPITVRVRNVVSKQLR